MRFVQFALEDVRRAGNVSRVRMLSTHQQRLQLGKGPMYWSTCLLTLGSLMTVALPLRAWAAFGKPTRSQNGMVVSAHPLASQAGLEILKQGGNAVDAAVATTFAISVVEPFSAGIGGGGFLLLRQAQTNQIKALDFREKAPLKASQGMYLDARGQVRPRTSIDGHLAVAVPGTVAGLQEVHQQHGQLPWRAVLAPAVQLAEQGFRVSDRFVRATRRRQPMFRKNSAAEQVFTRKGQLYQPGDRLVQSDLAKTLRAIAQDPRVFYTGWIAEAIATDMAQNGGLITQEDLNRYQPTWRTPVCGLFLQSRVCSMPPPSSGGVHLLQMLNLIESTDLHTKAWDDPDRLHGLAEIMKIAYADRAVYLGDPDFVRVPIAALISRQYAQKRRPEIQFDRARSSAQVKAADPEVLNELLKRQEPSDTSHLTVVDRDHNAVSLTFTINLGFGAGVVVPGTGIVLNNEMDDFAIAPGVPNAFGLVGGEANAIAPRKVPLSSMTPTIVTAHNQLQLATGAPGGSTIITTVLQIVLNVLANDMDAGRAVSAPRLHHQWQPQTLRVERDGFTPLTLEILSQRGHQIQERSGWGNANVILVTPEQTLESAADPVVRARHWASKPPDSNPNPDDRAHLPLKRYYLCFQIHSMAPI